MTSIFGRINDQANILKSLSSDVEKAVIKATRHNVKPPKEKHVRRLIVETSSPGSKIGELIAMISKRLELPDWIVVMKTLEVIHRLMREGNSHFISELRYKAGMLNLRKFADVTSPEASHQSMFVRKYSQYLEEKVLVYKILGIQFESDPAVIKTYTVEETFERIPRLQSQFNALLNCRSSKEHINNAITIYAFNLMLKDSFKLYRALNDAIIILLERFFNMTKGNAVKALEIYKLFLKEADGIVQFFDISRKFSRSDLPEIKLAPPLTDAMENFINDLDSGKAPSQSDSRAVAKTTEHLHSQGSQVAERENVDLFAEDEFSFDPRGNQPQQAQPQATPAFAFDPFQTQDTNQPVTSGSPGFNPFGLDSEDLATSALPVMSNPFGADPFNSSPPPGGRAPAPFENKKKQIEMLYSSDPLTPQAQAQAQAQAFPTTTFGFNAPAQQTFPQYNNPQMNPQMGNPQMGNPQMGNPGMQGGFNNPFFGTPTQGAFPQQGFNNPPVNNNAANNNNPFL